MNSLVNDTSVQITSRSEIIVREKEDRLLFNPDAWSLLSVSISWLDQASLCDPTGRVTAGVIRLGGLLVRVDLATIPCSSSTKSTYTTSGGSPIRAEGQPLTFVREHKDAGMTGMEKPRWYEIICDEDAVKTSPDLDHAQNNQCMSVKDESTVCSLENTRNEQRMYFCTSVGEMVGSLTGGQRDWFLVLQKTVEAEETYQRVGIGYFQYCKRSFPLFDGSDVRNISLRYHCDTREEVSTTPGRHFVSVSSCSIFYIPHYKSITGSSL